MICYTDDEYLETKQIRLGKRAMPARFVSPSAWVADRYCTAVPLNIYLDRIEPDDRPRLQLIFERERDSKAFHEAHSGNFDAARQAEIAAVFGPTLTKAERPRFGGSRLLVIFSAFEPAARWEANDSIGAAEERRIERAIDSPLLWKIYPIFETVVFFVHTDAQLKMLDETDFKRRCCEAYAAVLSEFDEFGYFRETPIAARFDSRETFEREYEGNWFSYAR